MLDKTIISALTELRKRQSRAGADLVHVDALLLGFGIELTRPKPRKPYKPYRKRHAVGYLRRIIFDTLRQRPLTGRAMADVMIARVPEVPAVSLRRQTYSAMWKMGQLGQLVKDGRVWRLAHPINHLHN